MGKTNPIGVRFDEELLNKVKEASLATSPQKALNLYEKSYVELIEKKVAENNKPENKAKIEAERNPNPMLQDEAGQNPLLAIHEEIAAIRAEKIPKDRDTPLGRKVWENDQKKRILELQEKLKH